MCQEAQYRVMKKTTFAIVLLLLIAEFADAQSFYSRRRDRKLMASVGIGSSTYHGDLHTIFYDGLQVNPNLVAGLRYKLGSQLSFRADVNWFRMSGSDLDEKEGDDDRIQRNLSFRSFNLEASGHFVFDLIPNRGSYTRRPLLNPYITIGLGLVTNNPQAFYQEEWHDLRPLQTENVAYKGLLLSVPVGLGIRLRANQAIDIIAEGNYRFTFTDYLDDVSTVHQEPGSLSSDLARALSDRASEAGWPVREPGLIRGNPEKNDGYFFLQVRLEFYLPPNVFQSLFSPTRRKPKFR